MPSFQLEGRRKLESTTSRLGQSLIRLHQSLEQNRHCDMNIQSLFESWQQKWSSRRAQIARRLELIENQLEDLSDHPKPAPRLAVVGVPADGGEMASMPTY